MFTDIAKIYIKAGNGGNGAVSFHREKYVPNGGPDGGDGGKGGNVVFVVSDHVNTLIDFKYKKKFVAENGENGGAARCSGKKGQDVIITVPAGTLIKDAASGDIIHDMSDKEPFIALTGGNGGWGNTHFATPTRQTPRFAKSGIKGKELEVILELKLLADVGLIGFPNVGKSTLISMVSSAKPKIANYHFTTLTPVLGVISFAPGESIVMADIPGIIEGASEGVGLGHDFLRHIDRCRLLIHLVDIASSEGRNPIEDFEAINKELENYSEELSRRPQIVVGNKADLIYDKEISEEFKKYVTEKGYKYFEISAATTKGVDDLLKEIRHQMSVLPPLKVYESTYVEPLEKDPDDRSVEITRDNNVYYVEGEWLINVIGSVNFEDYESLQYFQRVLRKSGVIDKLTEKGIKEGDIVSIYDVEFEFVL